MVAVKRRNKTAVSLLLKHAKTDVNAVDKVQYFETLYLPFNNNYPSFPLMFFPLFISFVLCSAY
jgi:hypothetical protein